MLCAMPISSSSILLGRLFFILINIHHSTNCVLSQLTAARKKAHKKGLQGINE